MGDIREHLTWTLERYKLVNLNNTDKFYFLAYTLSWCLVYDGWQISSHFSEVVRQRMFTPQVFRPNKKSFNKLRCFLPSLVLCFFPVDSSWAFRRTLPRVFRAIPEVEPRNSTTRIALNSGLPPRSPKGRNARYATVVNNFTKTYFCTDILAWKTCEYTGLT